MIGILIVTHGKFGEELLRSAELILGKQEKATCFSLNHGDDVNKLKKNVRKAVEELDDGDGVIVLTDLFGGSPSNVTSANMKDIQFQSITGVNLPMLLEALMLKNISNLMDLTDSCIQAGKNGIRNLYKEIYEDLK